LRELRELRELRKLRETREKFPIPKQQITNNK